MNTYKKATPSHIRLRRAVLSGRRASRGPVGRFSSAACLEDRITTRLQQQVENFDRALPVFSPGIFPVGSGNLEHAGKGDA